MRSQDREQVGKDFSNRQIGGDFAHRRCWGGPAGVVYEVSKSCWCRMQDSNPRPSVYKTAALPTELIRPSHEAFDTSGVENLAVVELRGIEPLTSAVRLQRSPI